MYRANKREKELVEEDDRVEIIPKPKIRHRESEKLNFELEPVLDVELFSKTTNGFLNKNEKKLEKGVQKEKSMITIIKKKDIVDMSPYGMRKSSVSRLKLKGAKTPLGLSQKDFHKEAKNYFYNPDMFTSAFETVEAKGESLIKQSDAACKDDEIDVNSTSFTNGPKPKFEKKIYLHKKHLRNLINYDEEGKLFSRFHTKIECRLLLAF